MDYREIKNLVESAGPWGIGETKRYNHSACPEGTDTRRRWYVTHENDGTYSVYKGYCHNCGRGAVYREIALVKPCMDPLAVPPTEDNIALPDDCLLMTDARVPIEARAWVEKYGLLHQTIIQYSPQYQRIVLPVYNGGEVIGYQMRRVGDWNGPKYITVKGKRPLEWMTERHENPYVARMVFVEDLMSFWRIKGSGAAHATPLLGLHFRAEYIAKRLKLYPNAKPIIWFDNDQRVPWEKGPTKIPAEHLQALCGALGRPATIIEDMYDPKHYSTQEINDRLNRIP